jgi:aspartyl-tRNA(Asn)/glutamyl-tRNA(Gln) amidotransferase subunit C
MKAEDVKRVANLARIRLTDEEITKYTNDLNDIVEYAETLKCVDISGVQPMVSPLTVAIPLRQDVAQPSLGQKATLQAASQTKNGHFKVPRTIGEG